MNRDEITEKVNRWKITILAAVYEIHTPHHMEARAAVAAAELTIEKKMLQIRSALMKAHNVCPESGLSDCATEHCGIHGRKD